MNNLMASKIDFSLSSTQQEKDTFKQKISQQPLKIFITFANMKKVS